MKSFKLVLTVNTQYMTLSNTSRDIREIFGEVSEDINVYGEGAYNWLVENSTKLIKVFGSHVTNFLIVECEAWCNSFECEDLDTPDFQDLVNSFAVQLVRVESK